VQSEKGSAITFRQKPEFIEKVELQKYITG